MADVELLRQAVHFIREHPDRWEQSEWRTGDRGCFAYVVAQLAGGEVRSPGCGCGMCVACSDDRLVLNDAARQLGITEEDPHISDFAARALGVPWYDALFDPANSLADLEDLVEECACIPDYPAA